jgi:hypothetical protein
MTMVVFMLGCLVDLKYIDIKIYFVKQLFQ